MQGRRMGAIAGSAVGRGLSGGSKGPATWICIAVSRVVDHGYRGSEGRSSNLEKAGAADLPSIPFPPTMLGIVPARRTNGQNRPTPGETGKPSYFHRRGSASKGLSAPGLRLVARQPAR